MDKLQLIFLLSALLFSLGIGVILIKRNTIMMLLGIELMLNASNINLVAFNQIHSNNLHGQMFTIFVIVIAVCEAAVGLALILRVYQHYKTSRPDELSDLKG